MTQQERQDAIRQIASLPEQIQAIIAGRPDSVLDKTYRPGSWTARQIIHHLADAHMHAYIRARITLTEDHAELKPYDQDVWARLQDASRGQVEPSLAILKGLHARLAVFFRTLPEEAYARTAHHPERGDLSLDDQLALYAAHGAKHLLNLRAAITS
jgi:hypothetical protein